MPEKWGKNLLGEALMKRRGEIMTSPQYVEEVRQAYVEMGLPVPRKRQPEPESEDESLPRKKKNKKQKN